MGGVFEAELSYLEHKVKEIEDMLSDGEKGVIIQRDKESYAVAPLLPCGLVTPQTLRKLADVAEKYQVPAMKVTSAARIALVGLKEDQVDGVW